MLHALENTERPTFLQRWAESFVDKRVYLQRVDYVIIRKRTSLQFIDGYIVNHIFYRISTATSLLLYTMISQNADGCLMRSILTNARLDFSKLMFKAISNVEMNVAVRQGTRCYFKKHEKELYYSCSQQTA